MKLLRVIVSVRSLIASLRSVIVINLDWKSDASSAHAWSDDKDFFLTRFVKHFLGLRSKMILINYSFFESLISYYGKNVWWIRWNWLLLCKHFLTVTLFRIAGYNMKSARTCNLNTFSDVKCRYALILQRF